MIPPTVSKKNALTAYLFHSSESGNNQSTQHFAPQPTNGFNDAKGKAISKNWMFLQSGFTWQVFRFFVVVIFMDCNRNKHEATENLWYNLNSWKLLSCVLREMNQIECTAYPRVDHDPRFDHRLTVT